MEHGHARRGKNRTREYTQWASAKGRCYNPKNKSYRNYGARGIKMCGQWINNFPTFLRDMGPCPQGLTLERMNNDGDYESNNCRWATRAEQNNNKRTVRLFTVEGETLSLSAWCKRLGISHVTALRRLAAGWSIKDAIFTLPIPPSERAGKLKAFDIITIRELSDRMSQKEITRHYHVCRETIRRIVHRKTYKHY